MEYYRDLSQLQYQAKQDGQSSPEGRAEMRKLNEMIIALKHSSTNTICKLISLIKKMAEKGLWLTYK